MGTGVVQGVGSSDCCLARASSTISIFPCLGRSLFATGLSVAVWLSGFWVPAKAQTASTIIGTVRDADTLEPIAGAVVTLRPIAAKMASILAVTGRDGRFYKTVGAGDYVVAATNVGYWPSQYHIDFSAFAAWTGSVVAEQARDVDLDLVRGAVIAGQVVDFRGLPVQNAAVEAILIRTTTKCWV